ncbi:MAG TPA: CBS domain-containing protein [Candidatus Binatia bacterium]
MTKPAICVHEEEDVEGVIAKMTDENISNLRVTAEDGRQEH